MPFAITYLTGNMLELPASTEPTPHWQKELFVLKDDAIERAWELLEEGNYQDVLVHDENGEPLYDQNDLRTMRLAETTGG